MRFPACLVLPLLMTCVAAFAGEEVIKDSQGMDCFVYTPDPVDAAKTYQLVVGVHGAGGKGNGAAGMKDWAKRGDVIVIGPSFETKGDRPYQNGDGIHYWHVPVTGCELDYSDVVVESERDPIKRLRAVG